MAYLRRPADSRRLSDPIPSGDRLVGCDISHTAERMRLPAVIFEAPQPLEHMAESVVVDRADRAVFT